MMKSYLSRSKVYEKAEPSKNAMKIYIFCEGQDTESKYFGYFKGLSSNINVIPIPNQNGQSDPLKLKERAIFLFYGDEDLPESSLEFKLSKEYKDQVWFVIDTDRWNEGNKIGLLREFCDSKNTEYPHWFVAQSNPCFELWQYYHFYDTKPNEVEVNQCTTFKEFVAIQIRGGFDSRKMPIELSAAIENSINNFESTNNQPKLYSTEVHLLGQIVLPFVKDKLKIAKEMMQIL